MVDPSKIIRPDNRVTRGRIKLPILLSQSNYDSFICQMKESSSFCGGVFRHLYDKAQAYAAFGGIPATDGTVY